ncbi:MAG: transcriptional repressor [Patescibacteria group bacterium]|jgi:Fe2+ or Zn2+ uptake regulation protein
MQSSKASNATKLPGRRTSRTRQNIIDVLREKHCCTVEELIEVSPASDSPHKTTVYRELGCLMSNGIVKQLDFGDGRKRYELADGDHHHHLICNSCGSTQPVAIKDGLTKKITPLASSLGFIVTDHALEFFGFCKRCAK